MLRHSGLRLVLLTVLVGLLAAAPAARAEHGQADPNLNMTHLANEPSTGATNSDLAFWNELAFAGNYNGFRIFSIANPRDPKLLSNTICRGAQSDVGVYGDGEQLLLFQSVDARQTEPTGRCSTPVPGGSLTGWEGVRIFDVTDPRDPVFIKGVATDCGSHTHTVVPDDKNDRVFIYVSSYPLQGQGTHDDPDEPDHQTECIPPHQKISVIEVPLEAPETARVVNEPSTGPGTVGCHDIGVFMEIKRAAAACLTEGQIWDISDPVNPVILHRIHNPRVEIWHSGAFTWDGQVAIFGDEEAGAAASHGCGPFGPPGATWFYRVAAPEFPIGYFAQPRFQLPQGDLVCTTHNYNPIPVTDSYLLASAFYEAGTGIVDFTEARTLPPSPAGFFTPVGREIAFYESEDGDGRGEADTWSSYWYKQYVYANDIERGFDVFQHLGKETNGARSLHHLNPQTQERLLTGPRG